MATGGTIVWNLDIDDSKFKAGLDDAANQAQKTANKINKIDFKGIANSASQSFGNIANSIQRTATIVGGLGLGLGAVFIKSAADLEKTSRSFEVLTGNAEVANKLFAQIKQFADKTPFEFPDLARGAQALLGFGRNADQAFKDIKTLGDIAAATGADFNSLAVVFGQVNATGKLMGQDALQLINNNIPITTLLAKDLGISVQEVKARMEDGAISADIFNTALQNATKQGGFAFEGTNKLATTLNGRLSTLKDTVLEFGRNLLGVKVDPELGFVVQEGGIFDRFSKFIPVLIQGLSELAPKVLAAFDWIIAHKDILIAVFIGLAAAFVAAKVAAIALAIVGLGTIGLVAAGVVLAVGLIAGAAYLIVKNWSTVKEFFINLGKSILDVVTFLPKLLFNAGKDLIFGLINGINSAKDAVVNKIKEIASSALGAIKNFFGIRSPSTVMAEQGEFMMIGLQRGLEKASVPLLRTADSLASDIMSKFTGGGAGSLSYDASGQTGGSVGGGTGVTIHQTNNINNPVDLEAANRELGWRLAT